MSSTTRSWAGERPPALAPSHFNLGCLGNKHIERGWLFRVARFRIRDYTRQIVGCFADNFRSFLERISAYDHWNEKIFYNLTDELLADSITTDLLYAFNNIHFYGGQIVPASHFIKALKKLIFTGRVSDFDPEYYINLANKHIQDKKITFVESQYNDFMEQAALRYHFNRSFSC